MHEGVQLLHLGTWEVNRLMELHHNMYEDHYHPSGVAWLHHHLDHHWHHDHPKKRNCHHQQYDLHSHHMRKRYWCWEYCIPPQLDLVVTPSDLTGSGWWLADFSIPIIIWKQSGIEPTPDGWSLTQFDIEMNTLVATMNLLVLCNHRSALQSIELRASLENILIIETVAPARN